MSDPARVSELQELEANYFARCLLLPEVLFREKCFLLKITFDEKGINRLVAIFDVPYEQVVLRLVELEMLKGMIE